ncbi:hypothetical protein [Jannaschia formosa]|uniref:hypothetical protein n=1 Tax=Jannaschia formosa TaxID=2259592 RepID=UPI001075296E|nr:hypothetical protein [Jannaschia formosa]TFL19863.1 hypothetical protein DR046_00505 [Jannaschia formosa]
MILDNLDNATVGALFGALSGGLITGLVTLWVQNRSFARDREEARSRRSSEDYSHTLRFYAGYQTMAARLRVLDDHISSCFEDASEQGLEEVEPWALVIPVISSPVEQVFYTVDDLVLLSRSKEFSLLSDLQLAQLSVQSTLASFAHYGSLRTELQNFLPAKEMDGLVGRVEARGEAAQRALSHIAMLNDLIGQIIENIEIDRQRLADLTPRVGVALRAASGDPEFPVLKIPG